MAGASALNIPARIQEIKSMIQLNQKIQTTFLNFTNVTMYFLKIFQGFSMRKL